MRSLGQILFQYDSCPYERRLGHRHTQREDHVRNRDRRQPLVNQGERPQKEPTLLTPWSWTSSLQNCEEENFCFLELSSLWHIIMVALQTNTVIFPQYSLEVMRFVSHMLLNNALRSCFCPLYFAQHLALQPPVALWLWQ